MQWEFGLVLLFVFASQAAGIKSKPCFVYTATILRALTPEVLYNFHMLLHFYSLQIE